MADPTLRNQLLYRAVVDRDLHTVKYLLLREADPNCLTEEGASAFHIAVGLRDQKLSEEITNVLLLNGGDPNLRDPDGITPLHIAAAFGRYEILDALLGCGGDPTIRDLEGQTCMDLAQDCGSDQCVALLRLYNQENNVQETRKESCPVRAAEPAKPKPRKSVFKYTEQLQGVINEHYDQASFQVDVTSPDHPVLVSRTDLDSTYTVLKVHDKRDSSLLERTVVEEELSGENSFHTASPGGNSENNSPQSLQSLQNSEGESSPEILSCRQSTDIQTTPKTTKSPSIQNYTPEKRPSPQILKKDKIVENICLQSKARKVYSSPEQFKSRNDEKLMSGRRNSPNIRQDVKTDSYCKQKSTSNQTTSQKTTLNCLDRNLKQKTNLSPVTQKENLKGTPKSASGKTCENLAETSKSVTGNKRENLAEKLDNLTLNSTNFSLDPWDTQVLRDLTLNTTTCSCDVGTNEVSCGGDSGGIYNKYDVGRRFKCDKNCENFDRTYTKLEDLEGPTAPPVEELFTDDEDSLIVNYNTPKTKRYAIRKDSGFSSSVSHLYPDETILSRSTGLTNQDRDANVHPYFYDSPCTSSRLPTPESSPFSEGSDGSCPPPNFSVMTPSLQCSLSDISDVSVLRSHHSSSVVLNNESETHGKSQISFHRSQNESKDNSKSVHGTCGTQSQSGTVCQSSPCRSHITASNAVDNTLLYENKSETIGKSHDKFHLSNLTSDFNSKLSLPHSNEQLIDLEDTIHASDSIAGASTLILPESETVGKSQFTGATPRIRRLLSSASSTKSTSSTCSCKSVGSETHILSDVESGVSLVEIALPKDMDPNCSLHSGLNESCDSTMLYDWQDDNVESLLNSSTESKASIQSQPQVCVTSDIKELSDGKLRAELEEKGDRPGPITVNTRRAYEIRLARIRSDPQLVLYSANQQEFCPELTKALKGEDIVTADEIDTSLIRLFWDPKPTVNWREGTQKTSFTYLLMDPRVTQNLPARYKGLGDLVSFEVFVRSVFYVGKGKRSRPYAHFKEAIKHITGKTSKLPSKKITQIVTIWEAGLGVVSLHVFQNVIPAEAYTRESCLIQALGLKRLTNIQPGQSYGNVASWSRKKQRSAGVMMLRKAYNIFLMEGERQIRAYDIKS